MILPIYIEFCLSTLGGSVGLERTHFNSFYCGRVWWSWKNLLLTVSTLGEGLVVLKDLIFNSFYFKRVWWLCNVIDSSNIDNNMIQFMKNVNDPYIFSLLPYILVYKVHDFEFCSEWPCVSITWCLPLSKINLKPKLKL